jgi:transcriptional regulator with XRE-family HTH domain
MAPNRTPTPTAVVEHFGANMRRLRLHAGMSQERVAKLAGLHRTEVSLLERGGREPRLGTLVKLAGALEVSPAEFMDEIAWHWQSDQEHNGFYVLDRRVT